MSSAAQEEQCHGIVVTPQLGFRANKKLDITFKAMPKNKGSWTESPVASQVGLPIKVLFVKLGPGYNGPAANMLRVCDIDDPFCGATIAAAKKIEPLDLDGTDDVRGIYAFMRVDGKPLRFAHFDALQAFLDDTFKVYFPRNNGKRLAALSPEKQQRAKDYLSKKLTPNAFATFFNEYRAMSLLEGRKGWSAEDLNPVPLDLVTGNVCAWCAATEKPDGGELEACFRCHRRFYCSDMCGFHYSKKHERICKRIHGHGKKPKEGEKDFAKVQVTSPEDKLTAKERAYGIAMALAPLVGVLVLVFVLAWLFQPS